MTASLMRRETLEAPEAAARLLGAPVLADAAARLRAAGPRLVLFCGRGSSGHAGTALRYLISQHLGIATADALPSLASVYRSRLDLSGTVLVALSQSGRSPDLVAQTEAARAEGALTVALVNDPASPLARASDLVLDLRAGPERSVAATKSVLAELAAGAALIAHWAEDAALLAALARWPERLAAAATLDWSALAAVLAAHDHAFTVGRGVGMGIAGEAALKLAEVAGIAALAHSSAELAHGPRALAGPDFPALGFVQDDAARAGTEAMLADLAAAGAPVLAAGAAPVGATALPVLPPDHPALDLLPMLLAFYLAAEAAARARGRDPDHPPALRKVTETR
ncbi:MAG TPA: SIS domain-containing protein [Acetobacteraceae bacterium]|nr:SIS domain-containing protein [Acetobacteraceae bacterium]